jgi:molybdenum cofactor synthesis domain-containing protein
MTLVSIDDARGFVLSSCRRLEPVRTLLIESVGHVLAEPVRSSEPVPPFTNSSMDGYAVRSGDVKDAPARLRVSGVLMAGDDPGTLVVGEGEAARIMTGSVLPSGADAVCMVEHTRTEDGFVVIEEAVGPGTNVRHAGSDIATGDEVFAAGAQLSAAHIGVLASLGMEEVLVYPRPRVGVVSTGDELTSGPGPLKFGKVRDSNRPALLAQVKADGFVPVDLGSAADEPDALTKALQEAAQECDALLTSGGVSVGDRDIVRTVLEKLGGHHARWLQVAVRPGKPFAFSTFPPNGTPVFGLPGNPVSALVSYELFARPSLRLMAGHENLDRPRLVGRAAVDLLRRPDGRLHLVRVHAMASADGALHVWPSGGQSSHQLHALASANALALLPDGEGVAAGDIVEVMVLDADAL